MVTRANSARRRRFSICSALTTALPLTAVNDPMRCALTQLPRVCSMMPNVRAAEARLCPDSTSRTASCLNSCVYCFRVAFVIIPTTSHYNSPLRATFCGGKVRLPRRRSPASYSVQFFTRNFILGMW